MCQWDFCWVCSSDLIYLLNNLFNLFQSAGSYSDMQGVSSSYSRTKADASKSYNMIY